MSGQVRAGHFGRRDSQAVESLLPQIAIIPSEAENWLKAHWTAAQVGQRALIKNRPYRQCFTRERDGYGVWVCSDLARAHPPN